MLNLAEIEFPFKYVQPVDGNVYSTICYDPVIFSYKVKNEKIIGPVTTICYAEPMKRVDDFPRNIYIKCFQHDCCVLDHDFLLKMFDLFRRNHCIPSGINPVIEDNKSTLTLEQDGNYDKSQAYVMLCLFRWWNCNPQFLYELDVRIKEMPDMDFWSILHYVSAKHVYNCGHHFIRIQQSSYHNLAYSIAAKDFFLNLSYWNKRVKTFSGFSVVAIDKVVAQKYNNFKYNITNLEDIFNEENQKLYQINQL